MRMLRAAVVAVLVLVVGLAPVPARTQAASAHTITWDRYSLLIDGGRTFIWSGELHPFRLPSPSLWTDIPHSTPPPPAGQPVLTTDDHGFHHGDVWYRGRYTGEVAATTLSLHYGGGGAGMLQAWLDGVLLGQNELPAGVPAPATTGTATFTVPASLRTAVPHVLAVMVRNDSHNEDGGVNDAQKEGRGLIATAFANAAGAALTTAVAWRIQGVQGGENLADPVRGPLNNGGLFGERNGWSLPGFPDSGWQSRSVPDPTATAGTSWYRTTFSLKVPVGDDASLGLTIGDASKPRSGGHYRVLVFLNGWNMGQYAADIGPQLTTLGLASGGVPLVLDSSPAFAG